MKNQEIKINDIKSVLSLEKQGNFFGLSMNSKINSIKENMTGSDFKLELDSSITELNQKSVTEVLNLMKEYQNKTANMKDPAEIEKTKNEFKDKFKVLYDSIIVSGFKYNLSKFLIEGKGKSGASIGSFVAAMKVTVNPVDKIENFTLNNNVVVQSVFELKNSPYAQMLGMIVPPDIPVNNNGKDVSVSLIFNKGKLYINNKQINFNPAIIESQGALIGR